MKNIIFLLFCLGIAGSACFSQNKGQKVQCIQPVVVLSANVTICNGSSTPLTATITSSTTPPYDYAWTPNDGSINPAGTNTAALTNPVTANPTATTIYTVLVTDGAGCTSDPVTVTVTVVDPSVAGISYTGSPWCTTAGTQAVTQTGTAGGTYSSAGGLSINPASGLITPSASTAGTYTVTYTVNSPAPCPAATATTVVTITALPTAGISYSGSPWCSNLATAQTVTLTGTSGGIYSSSPAGLNMNGSGTITPNLSTPGTYTVTYTIVASGGCSAVSATAVVTITVLPTAGISYSGSPWCANLAGTQTVTLTGTAGGTYSATPAGLNMNGSGTITPNLSTVGTYTVTYTIASAGGCPAVAATAVVTIDALPALTLGGTNTICMGYSTTLNASGASSYVWSPSGSLNSAIISNPVATPTTSTNYSVVATGANSCTASGTYSVTVYATPTVSITGSATICSGAGNISLTGNGASSYVWNPGSVAGGSIVVSPTASGTYTVIGTDGNGCTGTASQNYTVYPQPTANAGADVSVCPGDNTTLSGTGNGTFLWSPATGLNCTTCANPISTPSAVITYTLSVTNNCGTAVDEVTITYPASPSANAGADVTICPVPGASTTLNGVGSGTVTWTPGGSLSCTSCTNPVATPSVTTIYTFSISASCGTASDMVTVTVASPTASITGNTTVCSGQPTTLTASGGVSYSWSTGVSTNPITDNPTTTTSYTVISTDGNGCTASDVITVNPSPLPTANAGADVSICIGSNTTLTATGTGTSYLWTPSTNLSCTTCPNPTADPSSSTTYTVTVTNNCGSASDDVAVSITPTPSVNAGNDVTICIGGNTSLNASGSGTYSWTPAAGLSNSTIANPIATPTAPTNYTVTITDICGSDSDEVMVDVQQLPVVNISGNDTICAGASSTLTVTGGGTYSWNTGNTDAGITVNPTANTGYAVTVTSAAGCTNTGTYSVSVITVTAGITGTSSTVCTGQSSTLTASGGGTYSWNTGTSATTIIVTPTGLTGYTVTATNSGCSGSASYSVSVTPQPTASVSASGNSTTICSGTNATLNASGGSNYSWSTGETTSTIFVSPASTSSYTVTVSNGACSSAASIGVTVNTSPTATLTTTGGLTSICIGGCNTLSASGGVSYVWSPGGQTDAFIIACPSSATTYTVVTTEANGCTDDANVLISVLPQVTAGVTGDTVICNGDISLLTASGGGYYFWSTGETTASINVNPVVNAGYAVTVSNGVCSDTAVINVSVNGVPTANATASPYTINIGSTTTLTAVTSTGTYTWSPTTGLSCDTCANPAANPTVTTIYIVTTIDANGCTAVDSVIVNVTLECEEIFIPSAFSPNNDGFNDFLYVRNPCVKDMDFTVYNRWGQKVFFTTDVTEGWNGTFHGKPVDPAVFFYILNVNFITGTSKYMDGNITLVR